MKAPKCFIQMQRIVLFFLLLAMTFSINLKAFAQIDSSLLTFEAPYEYRNGYNYSNLITVRFSNESVIPVTSHNAVLTGVNNISPAYQALKTFFSNVVTEEGGNPAQIVFSRSNIDDYVHNSLSPNIFKIHFPVMVNVDKITEQLRTKPYILNAAPPYIIMKTHVPNNDNGLPGTNLNPNWHINRIQAPNAWVFMQQYAIGLSTNERTVAMVDDGQVFENHTELLGKIGNAPYTYCPGYGDHATMVASCIAADASSTPANGPVGVGNDHLKVNSYSWDCGTPEAMLQVLMTNPLPRVLNFSWVFISNPFSNPPDPPLLPAAHFLPYALIPADFFAAFQDIMDAGITVVASAGNFMSRNVFGANPYACPGTQYCFSMRGIGYPFGLPGVIGVGATAINYANDPQHDYEYGMGSGNDNATYNQATSSGGNFNYNVILPNLAPIDDANQHLGYLDIVAPGVDIDMATWNSSNPTSTTATSTNTGTSMSSPITAGVIAAMMLVNPALNRDWATQILFETADKLGYNPNGLQEAELNSGIPFTKGYRYSNNNTFVESELDYIMGHGRVNMLSAVMNAAGLIAGGFTINGNAPFTYHDVTVENTNDQSYLQSPYNETYEYDAVLNQMGAHIIFTDPGVSMELAPNSTFRASNNTVISFQNKAALFLQPGNNNQATKFVLEQNPLTHLGSTLEIGNMNLEVNTLLEVNPACMLSVNGTITVKSGGMLHIKSGAFINIYNLGKIRVENGGYICIEDGASIVNHGEINLTATNIIVGLNTNLNIPNNASACLLLCDIETSTGYSAASTGTVNAPHCLAFTPSTYIHNISCTGSTGEIFIDVEGGVPPYTYNWSNGQQTALISGLTSGSYTVTISDAGTNVLTATFNVQSITAVLSSTTTNATCSGGINSGAATVSIAGGSAPFDYVWSTGNSTINSQSNSNTLANIQAGNYSVTVTDDEACAIVANIVVNNDPNDPPLNVAVTHHDACFGIDNGNASLAITGGASPVTRAWYNDIAVGSFANTNSVNNLAPGNYTVYVTDNFGCTVIEHLIIAEHPEITVSFNSVSAGSCTANTGSLTVVPAGSDNPVYQYQWDVTAGNQTTATVNNLPAGAYPVTVTDGNSCTQTGTGVISSGSSTLNITINSTDVTCNNNHDGTAIVTAVGGSGNYNYSWNTGSVTQSVSNLAPGTYSVSVYDNNNPLNCAFGSVLITQPNPLSFVMHQTQHCYGTDETATVTGGTPPYTYDWNPNGYTGDGTDTYYALQPGITYQLTVTDANACSYVQWFAINNTMIPPLQISVISSDASGCGNNDGEATVTSVLNGMSPYSYIWDDPQQQNVAHAVNLQPGTYTVTVTDATGTANCTATASVNIAASSPITLVMWHSDETCLGGGGDGTATVAPSGGTPPYTYAWIIGTGYQYNQTAINLSAGTYMVKVSDDVANCSFAFVTINPPPTIGLVLSSTQPSCSPGADGTANVVSVNGGSSPYTYIWNNGQATQNITGLIPGNYTVTVTTSEGCTASDNITVANAGLTFSMIRYDVTCNGGSNGEAFAIWVNGTPPYTYLWSNGATTDHIYNLPAGTYSLTVTDAAACTTSHSTTVNQPSPPVGFDLYIKDETPDIGCEPYNGFIWMSPNICNKQTNAPITNFNDEPIIYGQGSNYLYVKIHNRGASTYHATDGAVVNLHWTRARTGEIWPDYWYSTPPYYNNNYNGIWQGGLVTSLPVNSDIAPGGELVLSTAWTPPNPATLDPSGAPMNGFPMICYLARIIHPNDPMFLTSAGPVAPEVKNNNNIGTRNSWIIDMSGSTTNGNVSVGINNVYASTELTLDFEEADITPGPTFIDWGYVSIYFPSALYDRWIESGAKGSGIVVVPEEKAIRLTDGKAKIEGIYIAQDEYFPVTIGFKKTNISEPQNEYKYQYKLKVFRSGETEETGGFLFEINLKPQPLSAVISNSTYTSCSQACDASATVTASGGVPPYSYNWDVSAGQQSNNTVTGLCEGKYFVTVTDADGTTVVTNVQITANPSLFNYTGETTLTANTQWSGVNYKINSKINIPAGLTLTVANSVVQFGTFAGINIERGGKLIIENSSLRSMNSCSNMWQGIEVWGNKALTQTESNQGVIDLRNGAVIENALEAVRTIKTNADGTFDWNYTGGIIKVSGAVFRNNQNGIWIGAYHNTQLNGAIAQNKSYVLNSTFETTGTLSDPSKKPYEFIGLYDVEGIRIAGNTFQNINPVAVPINERGNGIMIYDARCSITDLCLSNTKPCTNSKPNVFYRLNDAIFVNPSNSLNSVTISRNEFNYNRYAVIVKGVKNPIITSNKINAYKYGMYLENLTGFKIEDNDFYSTYNSNGGCIINGVGSTTNVFYKNRFHDIKIGIQAQSPTGLQNKGLQIKCNQFSNIAYYDISVSSGAIANPQGTCGTLTSSANNIFSSTLYSSIFTNPSVVPFTYNYYPSTTFNTQPHNVGAAVNAHSCTGTQLWTYTSGCPSTIGGSIVPNPSTLKTNISALNAQILLLQNKIDGGSTQNLLNKISSNMSPGNLKNALLAPGPYLSDVVLIAAINRSNPLPNGILKEIIIPNSPVTADVMTVLNTKNLPAGIKADIQAVQTGTSARAILEQQISDIIQQKDLTVSELMRYYLNDTIIKTDSVIIFLSTQSDLESKKQLIQAYLLNKDCSNATALLNTLPQQTQEEITFKQFYAILIDLCSQGKNLFQLTPAQAQAIYTIVAGNTSLTSAAQSVLTLVYGEKYPEIIEELIISESQTLRGYLYNNPSCGNNPSVNDTIVILDTMLQVVQLSTPVITDAQGYFKFKFNDLLSLDPIANYTFGTQSGAVIQDTIFKTVSQWIAASPITLNLKKLKAEFTNDSAKCFDDSVHFTNKTLYGKKPYSYNWSFAFHAVSTQENPVYKYNAEGTYNVSLITTDAFGCTDTVQKQIIIPTCFTLAIFGTLYENLDCSGLPVPDDTLVLKDNAGNIVSSISPAITNTNGEFTFNPAELATLDTLALYSLATKSGFELENITAKTLSQWNAGSPLILNTANVNREWFSKYIGIDSTQAVASCIDLKGNIYVMGTYNYNNYSSGYLILKYDPAGNLLFSKDYKTQQFPNNYSYTFYVDSLSNIYISGTAFDNNGSSIYTLLCDSNGIEKWSAVYTASSYNTSNPSMYVDHQGNIYIGASGTDYNWFPNKIFIIKYNQLGQLQYEISYSNPAYIFNYLGSISVDKAGEIVLAGIHANTSNSVVPYIVKFSNTGNILWQEEILNSALIWSNNNFVLLDNSNNIYITGDFGTYKYSFDGSQLWYNNVPKYKLFFDLNNDILAYGYNNGLKKYNYLNGQLVMNISDLSISKVTTDNSNNIYALVEGKPGAVIKFNSQGSIIWSQSLSSISHYARGVDLKYSGSNNVYVAGYGSLSSSDGRGVAIIVKYSQCPSTASALRYSVDITQIPGLANNTESEESETVTLSVVEGNEYVKMFPNPNDGNFYFNYSLPENEKCQFSVSDPTGRLIYNIEIKGGRNTIFINSNDFSNGIYYYQVTAGKRLIKTEKLIITK